MAEVVSSFLVGLGYKVDKRSEQVALDSVKSASKRALQAGLDFGRSFSQKPVTQALAGAAKGVLGVSAAYAASTAITAKNTKKAAGVISESVPTAALVGGFGKASRAADGFANRFGSVAKRATQTGAKLANSVAGGMGSIAGGIGSSVASAGAAVGLSAVPVVGQVAAVAAAVGLAAKAAADGFSSAHLSADRFAQVYGVVAEDVINLGRTMEREGGAQDAIFGQLAALERMRAGLMVGDAEWIATAGRAGIDTAGIEAAKDSVQAYLSLADQMQRMSTGQRLNAAAALGLDDASIRLLSKGRAEIERLSKAQSSQRKITREMASLSATYSIEAKALGNNLAALSDVVAVAVLPRITSLLAGMNSLADRARTIPEYVDRARSAIGGIREQAASAVSRAADTISGYIPSISDATSRYGVRNVSTSTNNTTINKTQNVNQQLQQSQQLQQQLQPQNINLNATIELDGRAIGNKILQVMNDQNEIAMTNLTSSVAM